MVTLRVLNLAEAKFECTFGRGCDGVCCRNGRPLFYPEDIASTDARMDAVLPLLRPAARRLVEEQGYLSARTKRRNRVARVVGGWCVFFNQGCTLHQLGEAEGDPLKYKPAACALFPLDRDYDSTWYVRQKGYRGEIWDLACLDPAQSAVAASQSLVREIALAQHFTQSEPLKG
jgi:hypothetical protein